MEGLNEADIEWRESIPLGDMITPAPGFQETPKGPQEINNHSAGVTNA